MRRLAIIALAAAPALLAACSQINALTPVGGDVITGVRIATNDVLVDKGVTILVAPQCVTEASGFTCNGTTTDGQQIVSTATSTAPYDLVVTVGGAEIFRGTVQEVLDKAAQEAS